MPAPFEMARGSATSDCQFAYFTPQKSNSLYRYQWSTEKWEELPSAPYHDSGLVIIDGELTTVGGENESHHTSKLFTLRKYIWIEQYPSMNIARSKAAVVRSSDGKYVFVIGGEGGFGNQKTTAVELFHVKSSKWYELCDLPGPVLQPSATICGNQLYVIGGYDDGYSFSLKFLPHETSSDESIVSQLTLRNMTWKPLPLLEEIHATVATVCEQVVAIGGMDYELEVPVNVIYQLRNGQWVKIGSLSSYRGSCFVVTPSPDKAMIVGGKTSTDPDYYLLLDCDYVEECQGHLLPSDSVEELPSHGTQGGFLPSEGAQELLQPSECGQNIM